MDNPLNFKSTEAETEFLNLVVGKRDELLSTFSKNCLQQERTLSLFQKSLEHIQLNDIPKVKILWNVAGAINIISLDLKYMVKNMMLNGNDWEKRLNARAICTLIYESLNDVLELLGKEYRLVVLEIPGTENYLKILDTLRKELTLLRKKHKSYLSRIRNSVYAHRDKDVNLQLTEILNLSWLETFGIVNEFDQIINQLGQPMLDINNLASATLK
jgi:hypothetical protein